VLTDDALCAQMRERGLVQAARFTWEQAARQTAGLYRRVADHQNLTSLEQIYHDVNAV
jgi:DICT domain-containing protein